MAKGNYNIIRRLPIIHNAIASGKYPNKNTLIKIISAEFMDKELSTSTIGNDIEFLRCEYNAPIEFDFTRNGYYYTDKNFTLNLFNPAPEPFVSSDGLLKEEFAKAFGLNVSVLNLLDEFTFLGLPGQSEFEIHTEIGECGRYYYSRNIWIGLKKFNDIEACKLCVAVFDDYNNEKRSTKVLQLHHMNYIAEDWPSEGGYWLHHIFEENLLEQEVAIAQYEFRKMIRYLYPVDNI